jgi:hypothetical protein
MEPSDLFPIEQCSPRLKTAILAEFDGRSPTFQDILSLSPKQWMTVPGIGPSLLKELESITQNPSVIVRDDPSANATQLDLINRLEHLQSDLKKLRDDIESLMSEIPSEQESHDGSDFC